MKVSISLCVCLRMYAYACAFWCMCIFLCVHMCVCLWRTIVITLISPVPNVVFLPKEIFLFFFSFSPESDQRKR